MRISDRRHALQSTYTLHRHQLEGVNSEKYIRDIISQDLQWNKHINITTRKVTSTSFFSADTFAVVRNLFKHSRLCLVQAIDRCRSVCPIKPWHRTDTAQSSTIYIQQVHRHFPGLCHWTIIPTPVISYIKDEWTSVLSFLHQDPEHTSGDTISYILHTLGQQNKLWP